MMKRTARRVTRQGATVFIAGLLTLGIAGASHAAIVISSSSATVAPGGTATITYSMTGAQASDNVATYTADVQFDAGNLDISSSCLGGTNSGNVCVTNADCPGNGLCSANCTKDARLADQVGQFSRTAAGGLTLFIGDSSFPVATMGDGNLFTCTLAAKAGAAQASYPLTTSFLEVANADGDGIAGASATDGSITVEIPPTATETPVPPTPTETPVPPTATNTVPVPTKTNTSARTATHTPGAGDDDGGCHIAANGDLGASWMALIPAALWFALGRRRQRR